MDHIAKAAFALQMEANPYANHISWALCLKASKDSGTVLTEDQVEELEYCAERLWNDHKASPGYKGQRRSYQKDGSDGIPGWYAISDHRGYYLNIQYEQREDAELFCYWKTQQLEDGEGSYCPAIINDDLTTNCDI